MVVHTLAGLTGAIKPADAAAPQPVWGTFYDIRRYGGLQILLRALLGEGSLVLTAPGEPMADVPGAARAAVGVTHLTGTPSHWRRALMTPAVARRSRRAMCGSPARSPTRRCSTRLKARFPGVPVGHAYASTEAGVGFEVNDGLRRLSRPPIVGPRRRRSRCGSWTARCSCARRAPPAAIVGAAGAACGRRRLRRHRRHGRAARRSLPLRRPPRRRHQRRRPEGASGGDRGGDQPPSGRAHVARLGPQEARSPAPSSSPRWCSPSRRADEAAVQRGHPGRLPRASARRSRSRRCCASCRRWPLTAGGKLERAIA